MPAVRGATRRAIAAAVLVAAVVAATPQLAGADGALHVSSVSPHAIAQGATRTITISGTGFASGASVSVSGRGATVSQTNVLSATRITATVAMAPGALLGGRSVTVQQGGHRSTISGALRVTSPPTLFGISPDVGVRQGGVVRLALSGAGFEDGMRATIPGARVKRTTVLDAGHATVMASFATAVPGSATVTVTNPDEGSSTAFNGLAIDPAPRITSLSTTSITQDETTTETLSGTGFQPGAFVRVGPGVLAQVVTVTGTQLVLTLRTNRRTQFGPRSLTVVNPDGGTIVRTSAIHVGYAPIFTKWAVGDGAVEWVTTLRRPALGELPALSFSGTGITVASKTLRAGGVLAVGFSVASSAPATWRSMTMREGTTTWVVPRAVKVRRAPWISRFPSLPQGASFRTVTVTGANFEVCATSNPVVTISGTGVTVDDASPALGDLMYVSVSVAADATLGRRDVTMTNCDSGGRSTKVGGFKVTAS